MSFSRLRLPLAIVVLLASLSGNAAMVAISNEFTNFSGLAHATQNGQGGLVEQSVYLNGVEMTYDASQTPEINGAYSLFLVALNCQPVLRNSRSH